MGRINKYITNKHRKINRRLIAIIFLYTILGVIPILIDSFIMYFKMYKINNVFIDFTNKVFILYFVIDIIVILLEIALIYLWNCHFNKYKNKVKF